MSKRYPLVTALLALSCFSESCNVYEIKKNVCPSDMRTTAEILKVGDDKLTQFCDQHAFSRSEFTEPPEVRVIETEKIWVIDYNGRAHFVRFIVDNCGGIETNFGPKAQTTLTTP